MENVSVEIQSRVLIVGKKPIPSADTTTALRKHRKETFKQQLIQQQQ